MNSIEQSKLTLWQIGQELRAKLEEGTKSEPHLHIEGIIAISSAISSIEEAWETLTLMHQETK